MDNDYEPLEAMEAIAAKRGCLLKGGSYDYEKVSRIILDEFRRGMMGKITLEYPRRGE
jgi:ribosome biogenesis GTPase A